MAKQYVAVCTECKSTQRDSRIENSPVYSGPGNSSPVPSCAYCGGVVIIAVKDDLKRVLSQHDKGRGL